MRIVRRYTIAIFITTLGCSDDSSPGRPDGGMEPDAYVEPETCPELDPVVQTVAEPEQIVITAWRSAVSTGIDDVLPKLQDGTFTYPEGDVHEGLTWGNAITDEEGDLGSYPYPAFPVVYLAGRVTFDEPTRIILRSENTRDVFLNGAAQPGDIYGSGRMRVPMLAQAGENVIVVRGSNRGTIRVQMWTTPDEVFFNTADLERPDFVEGDDSELHLGVPVLNLNESPAACVRARVVESDQFEATTVVHTSLPGGGVTQVPFLLEPKMPFPAAEPEATIPVTIRIEGEGLSSAYETELEIPLVESGIAYRRTFRSPDDGSVQYYAVLPPSGYDPTQSYSLILSLHGAGVQALGQARSYSPKDWAFLVAATNRRPFGFDWEEWGRLNALYSMDDAMARFPIDPTRTYLTGHSMGGHGTWHVGVMHPDRFAVIGPSAGWGSFYSYTGLPRPTGTLARARAHSDTLVYLSNIARRGVYVLHGDADDNVPLTEGQTMRAAAVAVGADVEYHEEPGAGHWWDGDASDGVDCVDWPPMMDMMQARQLDPVELDFEFKSPSPAYSPRHSFVTLQSAEDPFADLVIASASDGTTVAITTTNVRSLEIDGAALEAAGIDEVVVDGDSHAVEGVPIWIGPETGKNKDVYGTYNQVFHRPHCYIYPENGDAYAKHAAFLSGYWSIIGNGRACALPLSELTPEIKDAHNLIYLGISSEEIGAPDVPFEWDEEGVRFNGGDNRDAALMFVFPDGDRLNALLAAPAGKERYLQAIVPFSSRSGWPDFMIWSGAGLQVSGFFDADWQYDPALDIP